ncbi:S-adenosyl-L-methionine-dependent methyltransferase [Xylariomycetidae sp. FL2044]|nr:S-adenosyl-L-methionine-dependent methyltransferase [Xylariomycetidae sp. FL2044]
MAAASTSDPTNNIQDRRHLSDSESQGSRDDDNEVWDDYDDDGDEEEEETQEVISLLDDLVFPDIMSMLEHCREKHGFDFLAVRQRLGLDFHGCVRLVNFTSVRQRVHEGLPVSQDAIAAADIEKDQYLKPVLDDDAVILSLFDLPELPPAAGAAEVAGAQGGNDDSALTNDLLRRNAELQEQLARVTAQFESYRGAVSQTLDERWGDVDQAEAEAGRNKGKGKAGEVAVKEDDSKYYWESYAGADIHETMLKDTVRTEAYRDFIYNNKHLFAGKTVLDIGCGTGILSMFCARAGASRVLAVDASAILNKARENIFHNGLDSTITCISGRIEEVTLPVDRVDVIVSEWMGYCLLFEAMLPSVLWARDRYLEPDGLLVPSHTSLWLAPVADPGWVADNVAFWRDVYGFDMRAMQTGIYDDVRVLHWPDAAATAATTATGGKDTGTGGGGDRVIGQACAFKMLDLYRISTADLSFTAPFSTALGQDVDALDGFLIWFDTFFSPTRPVSSSAVDDDSSTPPTKDPNPVPDDATALEWAKPPAEKKKGLLQEETDRVAFTTGPYGKETHWRQGLLLCDQQQGGDDDEDDANNNNKATAVAVVKKDERIEGEITFSIPEDHARGLDLEIKWDCGAGGGDGEEEEEKGKKQKKQKQQKWALK